MWHKTDVTKKLGITYPIIQAPMAGASSHPDLVAAVSNAGGLGSYGGGYLSSEKIYETIKKIRNLTDRPFNFNLFVPNSYEDSKEKKEDMLQTLTPYFHKLGLKNVPNPSKYAPTFDEQMEVIIEEKVPIFSFTFGIPSEKWIKRLKKAGIVIIGTATHIKEAIELEKQGIDCIVGQGSEAGGHRGTFIGSEKEALIGTFALIPQIIDRVNIPVIAAGGIMNSKGIYAALSLGAQAAQIGTAFLTSDECPIHTDYKNLLLNLDEDQTVLTRAFSGRLARSIRNRFLDEMKIYEDQILDYPIQNALTSPLRKAASEQGALEFMSLWAGQGAPLCQKKKAKDFIDQWVKEINALT